MQETAAKAVLDAQRAAQRELKLLSAKEIREVADSVLNPPAAATAAAGGGAAAAAAAKPKASKSVFGSLFGGKAIEVCIFPASVQQCCGFPGLAAT